MESETDSQINFYLPSHFHCGSYALNNPYDLEIVKVNNDTDVSIVESYRRRSTWYVMKNGTVVFTLGHLVRTDFGRYLLRNGSYLIQKTGCDVFYDLRNVEDGE